MVRYIVKRDLKSFFPSEFSNRTLIAQFLDYIMNNFFQTSNEKEVKGYIGKKTVATEENDYYITEQTNDRQHYQLSPAILTLNEKTTEIENVTEYCNFINSLKLQNVNTDDMARIVSEKYWSWAPLIDIDMFINYNFYYWMPDGPATIVFTDSTDIQSEVIGKSNWTFVDPTTSENRTLKTGMKIRITNDINPELNGLYLVDGVGTSISLIEEDETTEYETPEYFVMDRGCRDGNQWSKMNRWFHRDLIESGTEGTTLISAKKPIISFNKDMKLYNFGDYSRGDVDYVYYGTLASLNGHEPVEAFQEDKRLQDGDRILLIDDKDGVGTNKIYLVTGIETLGIIVLQLSYDGQSMDGEPVNGECIRVKSGTYKDKNFYYNGSEWVYGQNKITRNQSPLFDLYDEDGVKLDNPIDYPQSTFKGCTIYDYKTNDSPEVEEDEDLNRKLYLNKDEEGNYIFNNTLTSSEYTYSGYEGKVETISRMKYVKINGTNKLINDWHLAKEHNLQYIATEMNIFDINYIETDNVKYLPIELAYKPYSSEYRNDIIVLINGKEIKKGTDYVLDNQTLKLYVDITKTDNIYIKLLAPKITGELVDGYFFELPYSLTANPKNLDISEIKYNECFDHMITIIENQKDFTGVGSGSNNYYTSRKDASLGTVIVQHSAPIVRSMLLSMKDETNVKNAINYVSYEYNKFKTKFKNAITQLSNKGEYIELDNESSVDLGNVVSKALEKINIGKEGLQPFYNNSVCEEWGNVYIPSTPSFLGLDTIYKPRVTTVEEKEGGSKTILCHDGSYQNVFDDYRDDALLFLENKIYESINSKLKYRHIVDKFNHIPGKFRTTDYSLDEFNELLIPYFEKWCVDNNYSYKENIVYDSKDPMTWNYSVCSDVDDEPLHGTYKSIYMYYYDTYRPHICPWEMLGFGDKPEWWEDQYGEAPYTSANIQMWIDIENGHIVNGEFKGYYEQFKRPGLVEKFLPVDKNGNLLSPILAGIISKNPTMYYTSQEFNFGDMGLIETMWRYTSDYRFALQNVLYSMRPINWVEEYWNTIDRTTLFKDTDYEQIIYTDTGTRALNEKEYMHNEETDDGYVQEIGIQQWISDYLLSQNHNITDYYGSLYRNVDIRLMYRCGAYYKQGTIDVYSDNYGKLPKSNYKLKIYKSHSPDVFSYSAIIVQKVDNGYMIDGYDINHTYFKVLKPIVGGPKTNVEINGRSVTYYNNWSDEISIVDYKTVYSSVQELFTIICGYGKYLENVEGWEFQSLTSDGVLISYELKAEDFLKWTSFDPENGMIIILNPAAEKVRINHNAMLDTVGKYLNGVWTVMGTSKKAIYNNKLIVYRNQGYTDIETKEDLITKLNLNCLEYEHCLIFDNETAYGDIIFNPLVGSVVERLKINGVCAQNWNGTFLAPGYIITENGCLPNYDKLVDDFTAMYDTDDIRTYGEYRELVERTIGFQESNTMNNLLLSNKSSFDFYKGSLKSKGTKQSLNKLNKSTYIMNTDSSNISLYDNWAFKLSDFGYTTNDSTIELNIENSKVTQNPQIISFALNNEENDNDSVIKINWNDDNWLKKIGNKGSNTLRFKNNILNPTGGCCKLSDTDYIVGTYDTYDLTKDDMEIGETIWVINDGIYDWNVYKKIGDIDYKSLKVSTLEELRDMSTSGLTNGDIVYVSKDIINNDKMIFNDDNGLVLDPMNETETLGYASFIYNDNYIGYMDDEYYVINEDYETIGVIDNETVRKAGINLSNKIFGYELTVQGTKYLMNQVYDDTQPIDSQCLGTIVGDDVIDKQNRIIGHTSNINILLAYKLVEGVPGNIIGYAELMASDNESEETQVANVYNFRGSNYTIRTIKPKVIDAKILDKCYLINDKTNETLSEIQIYDPLQSIIPNNVLKEVEYITAYDPIINYEENCNWGDDKVGTLWWDISALRYVDYYQGTVNERRDNWGKQLPGSEIAIYEWTKSSTLPDDVTLYVTKEKWNSQTLNNEIWYYYWVKNPSSIPSVGFRTRSALSISNIINNPTKEGIVWMAPVMYDQNSQESYIILANFDTVIGGNDFAIQINMKENKDLVSHSEWVMVREGDDDIIPTYLWSKMSDSLLGQDSTGNIVPDESLTERTKYGICIRPRQSMFMDMEMARHNFIDVCNIIFNNRSPSYATDVGTALFNEKFTDTDACVDEYDYAFDTHYDMTCVTDEFIGKTIYVASDENYDGIWTLWKMEGRNNFVLQNYQKYNMKDNWKYIDLYENNEVAVKQPDFIFDTEMDMYDYLRGNNIIVNSYIKVGDDNEWSLWEYLGKENDTISLKKVGLKNGTIKINDKCYSFLSDKSLIESEKIFIDGMTKYEYLCKASIQILKHIISYFEEN